MKASTCEQRDGYLGKWLTGDEQIEFEAHLANCLDCRQFIQEQQPLDGLLARANSALLPIPEGLIDQIDHRLRRARRRRVMAWATGLAAAGVLICTFAVRFFVQQAPSDGPVQSAIAEVAPHPSQLARDPRSLVQVNFQPSSGVIAVPRKTENPSVTIIWVYPTIKAGREPNPAPADSFQNPERNGI